MTYMASMYFDVMHFVKMNETTTTTSLKVSRHSITEANITADIYDRRNKWVVEDEEDVTCNPYVVLSERMR